MLVSLPPSIPCSHHSSLAACSRPLLAIPLPGRLPLLKPCCLAYYLELVSAVFFFFLVVLGIEPRPLGWPGQSTATKPCPTALSCSCSVSLQAESCLLCVAFLPDPLHILLVSRMVDRMGTERLVLGQSWRKS